MANACNWKAIDRFESLAHYEDFLASISRQVAAGSARPMAVDPAKAWGSAWDEKWYLCLGGNELWRLVAPDPPFRGIFKKVDP